MSLSGSGLQTPGKEVRIERVAQTNTTFIQAHEAFCETCPDPQQVTEVLAELGFSLDFQMDAIIPAKYSATAPLPAQYHYKTHDGCEIIYLAGKDRPEQGQILPKHASRFWAYSGAHPMLYQQVLQVLASTWSFAWDEVQPSSSQSVA